MFSIRITYIFVSFDFRLFWRSLQRILIKRIFHKFLTLKLKAAKKNGKEKYFYFNNKCHRKKKKRERNAIFSAFQMSNIIIFIFFFPRINFKSFLFFLIQSWIILFKFHSQKYSLNLTCIDIYLGQAKVFMQVLLQIFKFVRIFKF